MKQKNYYLKVHSVKPHRFVDKGQFVTFKNMVTGQLYWGENLNPERVCEVGQIFKLKHIEYN